MTAPSDKPRSFVFVANVSPYKLMRLVPTNTLYACWYDAATRQTRRRTLDTTEVEIAIITLRRAVDRGANGCDPAEFLVAPVITVDEALEAHLPYVEGLASAEAEKIQIVRLRRLLGPRRLAALVPDDFEKFRDLCLLEGLAISTISRTLSTLRSAVRRARKARRLNADEEPAIPEFRTKNHIRAAAPRGRVMTLAEVAKLVDAARELHLIVFLVLLLNTASRPGSLLQLEACQFDLDNRLVDLNRPGRVQTKKYRPILPLATTLEPWVAKLPPGPLITWRGEAIDEIDTAFHAACRRAGLPGGENPYSIRHTVARYMRKKGVETEQIAVWLGHIQPPDNPETTLLYSPFEPTYLVAAREAVADFVTEIAKLAGRNILEPPWASR